MWQENSAAMENANLTGSIRRLKRVVFTLIFNLHWLTQKTRFKLRTYELRWQRFLNRAGICEKCWTHTAHIVLAMLLVFLPIAQAETVFGKAAWFGENDPTDPWAHRVTASGEPFSEEALICALRHRRFGSFYRVTNLATGKSVVVRHTDFGPALQWRGRDLSDRVIDLSKAAFRRIADLRQGLIEVSVEEVWS